MKDLILLSIVLVLCIPQITSADDTKYEVTINVTYNSASPSKAAEIISKAQTQHKDACKVEIKSKKVSSDNIPNIGVGVMPAWDTDSSITLSCIKTEKEAINKCGNGGYLELLSDCFVCYSPRWRLQSQ